MGYWTRWRDKAGMAGAFDRMMGLCPRLREHATQAAGTMSGGEQQMLGIARALIASPRLIIDDNFSLDLAPMVVSQLFEALAAAKAEGASVLIVEQFVHMALANTHRAYVLTPNGQAVAPVTAENSPRDDTLVAC
jgi:branched-chain amino acid transport system ATP-binding protein